MMMRSVISLCFLCCVLQVAAQQEKIDTNFHVYLLIGQSNMAGRGVPDAESKIINERILMLDSFNRWIPATDPVHFDKPAMVGVGPAIAFANAMLEQNSKIKIGLIPCALGGSPIKVWEPGAVYLNKFHPYDDAIGSTQLAIKTGVLKGILWHQGESDNDSGRAAVYLQKLDTLINRFRTGLKQPTLPFVAGEIGYFNKADIINKFIDQLPGQVKHTAVVSAKDLAHKGDQLHFDTPSARELGKRYAEAMKQLQMNTTVAKMQQGPQPPVVVLSFDDAEISHYTIVAPLLKKFGFDASFMVCEMPWKTPADSQYYMNWQQIAQLYQMGFEIGNHTGHHKNMTKLNRAGMKEEIAYIEAKCAANGIPKPVSFAYPGNRSDSLSQVVLAEMGYRFARAGGSKYYEPQLDSKLAIPSYTMGSTEKLNDRTMQALNNLQPGQILAFTIHGVPDIAHPDYTTSEAVFTGFLQYMKDHHFKVIAMKDMDKYTGSSVSQ